MTSVDDSRSRWLSPLTLALLLVAPVTAARSGGSPFSGAPPQQAAGATPARPGNSVPADASAISLRQAVRRRLLVGTTVMSRQLDDPRLAELVAQQFDCLIAENEFKAMSLHRQPGRFNFAADKIVAFALGHRMKVLGHTLCWHSQSPPWIFRRPDSTPLPREDALRNLKSHIDSVMGHFRGKVVGWDVVNTTISDAKDQYLRDTPARRAISDEFIVSVFEFAHAAAPDAQFDYNDYNNERPEKSEKTIRLIRELMSQGARLDAVGIQSYLRLDQSDAADRLDQAIAAYAAEAVNAVISELDVDVLRGASAGPMSPPASGAEATPIGAACRPRWPRPSRVSTAGSSRFS